MSNFSPLTLQKIEALDRHFRRACAEVKQIGSHSLIKTVNYLPEPKDNILIGHVPFVGSVPPPIFDIDGLFPADNHFQLGRLEYLQVGEGDNLIEWRPQLINNGLDHLVRIEFDPKLPQISTFSRQSPLCSIRWRTSSDRSALAPLISASKWMGLWSLRKMWSSPTR